MVYQKISNVHLLCAFIHVLIHNSFTKYYWQNFAKPLAKALRKTSIDKKIVVFALIQFDKVKYPATILIQIIE